MRSIRTVHRNLLHPTSTNNDGDPSLLGKTIPVDGADFTVIGVMPREFEWQFWSGRPLDPAVLGSVSALLPAVALLASYLPVRRAAKIDPLVAPRCE